MTDSDRLGRILPMLACPVCRGPLRRDGEALECACCATRRTIRGGRAVLLPDPAASPRVMPESHVSNQPPHDFLDWVEKLDGWALNVGAGGTARKPANLVEMEYSVFRNTDVVGDAHHLPFADASFDAVATFNTFEHLCDPPAAAAEILRVLKPGGRLLLHTAFLQPVHEPPFHFYNTTEYGLRRWFRDFDVEEVSVSPNFQPAYVLAWLAAEMRHHLRAEQGEPAATLFGSTPMDQWADAWIDPAKRSGPAWEALGRLGQEAQKRFSGGFQLEATRPRGGVVPRARSVARAGARRALGLGARVKRRLVGR